MNTITRTDTPIDVTAVRRQLVQQGDEQLAQRRPFFKVMHGTLHGRQDAPRIEDVDGAAAWAYEGLVSAGTFAHTLAYVLRLLEQDAPEVALKVAAVVERVLDAGMDALEDANADLDVEAAADDDDPLAVRSGLMTAAQYEAFTAPGCHKCGTPFEFEGPKAQVRDTVYCRECAEAVAR